MTSGGAEAAEGDAALRDRFYRNDGNGAFSRVEDALPDVRESSGCVVAADYDVELTGFDSDTLTKLLIESEVDDDDPSDATGTDPGEDRYREQYGVIVMCEDEAEQQRVYEALHADGYQCRVVCT